MEKREKFNDYIEELIIDQFRKDGIGFDNKKSNDWIDDTFSFVVESIKKVVVKCVFEKLDTTDTDNSICYKKKDYKCKYNKVGQCVTTGACKFKEN